MIMIYIFFVVRRWHKEDIFLKEYPDILKCLKRDPSIEPRATAFFVKDGMKSNFENLFNKYFKDYFDLYTKKDVIDSKLFGDGEENPKFRRCYNWFGRNRQTDYRIEFSF